MIINVGQILSAIVSNFPVFLMISALFFFLLAAFNVEIRPPKIQVIDKLTQVRVVIMAVASLLFVLGLFFYGLPLFFSSHNSLRTVPTRTVTNSPTDVVTVESTPTDQFASNLIPSGKRPTVDDPLVDNSQGYEWDEETTPGGSCQFAQGHYLLSAPAGDTNGTGCTPENTRGVFQNFVYQIEMTILSGVGAGESGAGATFRVNPNGNGQQYQVTFTVAGNWLVETDTQVLRSNGPTCANPCPFFVNGVNHPNVLTISASGSVIQIQINGHPLGSYLDATYTSGYIGVQLSPGTESSSVAFSHLRLWVL